MICEVDKFTSENKKSFSNHVRWHNGSMNRSMLKGINLGSKNGSWKGENVGLIALHNYVRRRLPMPKNCMDCAEEKTLDLANISQKYKRELSDWEWLCRKCHMTKDGRIDNLNRDGRIEKKSTCKWCNKNKIKKGEFRCDPCAKSTYDPNKRDEPLRGVRWRKANGNYTPNP